ncbi:hypothetical protein N9E76_00520 [bacterium]|nr:hypothetical protein [bacterium]
MRQPTTLADQIPFLYGKLDRVQVRLIQLESENEEIRNQIKSVLHNFSTVEEEVELDVQAQHKEIEKQQDEIAENKKEITEKLENYYRDFKIYMAANEREIGEMYKENVSANMNFKKNVDELVKTLEQVQLQQQKQQDEITKKLQEHHKEFKAYVESNQEDIGFMTKQKDSANMKFKNDIVACIESLKVEMERQIQDALQQFRDMLEEGSFHTPPSSPRNIRKVNYLM